MEESTCKYVNKKTLNLIRTYMLGVDVKFWKKTFREAEQELEAATTRTALNAAAKKLMS
jgi:hypothetical protein